MTDADQTQEAGADADLQRPPATVGYGNNGAEFYGRFARSAVDDLGKPVLRYLPPARPIQVLKSEVGKVWTIEQGFYGPEITGVAGG